MEGLIIEYVAILWITIHSGHLNGDTFGIPYMTPEACKAGMKPVGDTLDYDYNMQCETLPVTKEMEP
jgi:hypothetical protein